MTEVIPDEKTICKIFNKEFLRMFQKWCKQKSLKEYTGRGDVDERAVLERLEKPQLETKSYEINICSTITDIFIFYHIVPDHRIACERLNGRKRIKRKIEIYSMC